MWSLKKVENLCRGTQFRLINLVGGICVALPSLYHLGALQSQRFPCVPLWAEDPVLQNPTPTHPTPLTPPPPHPPTPYLCIYEETEKYLEICSSRSHPQLQIGWVGSGQYVDITVPCASDSYNFQSSLAGLSHSYLLWERAWCHMLLIPASTHLFIPTSSGTVSY